MATVASNSIPVSPELMSALEQYALEAHKSLDVVANEALRFYIDMPPETNDLRRLDKQRAAALGIDIEDYVARMMKLWRQEDREAEERNAARRP